MYSLARSRSVSVVSASHVAQNARKRPSAASVSVGSGNSPPKDHLSAVPSMIESLSLLESPDLIIEQPIRLSIANPEGGVEASYCGFPQKDGSLIPGGITVGRLRRNFIRSGADIMSTWEIADFDIFAFMQPAKEVGGDFYDFYFAGKDRLAHVVENRRPPTVSER